ncbi:Sedoheptulokinase, partial [Phytophthora megakarya]
MHTARTASAAKSGDVAGSPAKAAAPPAGVGKAFGKQKRKAKHLHSAKQRKKLRLYSPHEADRSTSSDLDDSEEDKGNAPVRKRISAEELKGAEVDVDGDEDLPPHLQHLEEKAPRERSSKTKAERDAMLAAHVNIDNRLPPVPRKGYISWGTWEAAYKKYCEDNRIGFRTCTSKPVGVYNRKSNVHLDEATFHRSFVNYRCRHGVHQKRRGKGKRNTDVNYTGCRARFDVAIQN